MTDSQSLEQVPANTLETINLTIKRKVIEDLISTLSNYDLGQEDTITVAIERETAYDVLLAFAQATEATYGPGGGKRGGKGKEDGYIEPDTPCRRL